jgi:hypothetical protein
MQDRSAEGLKFLFIALLPGAIAAISPHPVIKLGAALTTVAVVAKASECFQDTAKYTYYQLKQASSYRRLQHSYY